jgi:hypothetical protein
MPAPVYQQQYDQRAAAAVSRGEPTPKKKPDSSDDDDFSFDDFLDIVNPLQHLPVISSLYRALTHDSIKPVERIAGDTLYGGLWGFVSSVANVAFEKLTGKDFGDTAIALLTGDDKTTAVAAASTAQQVATAAPARLSAFSYGADSAQISVAETSPGQMATAAPASLSKLASTGQTSGFDTGENADALALAASLRTRKVDSDLAARALAAYRRAVDVSQPALSPIF